MASLQNQIIEILQVKPSQKADEIARALGADRTQINRILYGELKSRVVQDRAYRWSLVTNSSRAASEENNEPQFANTPLARLCRYYLACLGYDETGISTFLTTKYGDPDYLEINSLPRSADFFAENMEARNLLGRKRSEQGRYSLYFGYPTHLNLIKSKKTNWEGFMVEPILLFPIEQDGGNGRLVVDLSYPIINQKPFQSFTNVERSMLMNELVQLEQELGLSGETARVSIDEIAMRLQSVRPEWPWKEDIDSSALERDRQPMATITEPGIYNRAVILMAEKSPFTQGLEKELRDLAQLPEEDYAKTALGRWIKGDASGFNSDIPDQSLLEVLPMNTEQRQAVSAALNRPVTIITGPPGTGKSQVVTNMLVNAAWSGKHVLFASKNNKAVDVVETRVNALGSRPILLRVGAQAYQTKLAEFVLSLLSSTSSSSEQEEFDDAKAAYERMMAESARLSDETRKLIDLRNDIDRREQAAEDARKLLGTDLFARSVELDLSAIKHATEALTKAVARADKNNAGSLIQLLWPLVKGARISYLTSLVENSSTLLSQLNIDLRSVSKNDLDISRIVSSIESANEKLSGMDKASSYLKALKDLQSSRSLEEIARDETTLLERISKHSQILWRLWLQLQPSRLSAKERQNLAKYTSLLKMVIEAGDEGQLSGQAYSKYSAMLKEISHLLPCWAVTALSARGRIPFEPGIFDVVVFDEASQCDIASTLPLLYRAKSVVIIGDPKQLSHISGLQKGQDQALLERYELMDDFPHWAYSHQSLFDLGATQVSGEEVIILADHHRSHSDIISFSNTEFYGDRLRVATRYDNLRSPNRSEPGIRWVDVRGRVVRPGNGGAINIVEAKAVVSTIRELVLDKGYQGSIGVVTPFRAQANAITEIVNQDEKLASIINQRGFLVDTVHKFQGDERDVMIFSPVVSADTPVGALGFLRSNGNLFNVAITRARAQLIVVGDMAECGGCDVGYLSRFAAYAGSLNRQSNEEIENLIKDFGPSYPNVAKPELVSDWERDFYISAYRAGLRLIPQYPIEKYIVDFLLVNDERKLVIEIDGERYHRNWTGELCRRDQMRNQRLFELGYDVMRFWVYELRDDMPGCVIKMKKWLSK